MFGGSLSSGVYARIPPGSSSEDYTIGSIIAVRGIKRTFLAVVGDVHHRTGVAAAESLSGSPEPPAQAISQLRGRTLGSMVTLIPVAQTDSSGEVEEATTIPDYLTEGSEPTEEEVAEFYGTPDYKLKWPIGSPKNSTAQVPLDVDALTRGCFGIFGKSGTGKTFLGNLIAAAIAVASRHMEGQPPVKLLILDMHSEYALKVKDQLGRDYEKGVGQALREEFLSYTIDKTLEQEHGLKMFTLPARSLTIEDIVACEKALGLTPKFIELLPSLARRIRSWLRENRDSRSWLEWLVKADEEEVQKFFREKSVQPGERHSLLSARSRLQRLEKFEFMAWAPIQEDSASEVVQAIVEQGRSCIVAFGRYGDDALAYMLVANILARRIWEKYVDMAMRGQKPRSRLVIFLEEAHKFLAPDVYYKTPFGNIARELRKRGVVLCIIDQRPSQISDEVMAMLWNKFIMNLAEEKDIETATIGLPFKKLFKPLVERLRRGEALLFGEAVKIPAVVKVADYRQMIKELEQEYKRTLETPESRALAEAYGY